MTQALARRGGPSVLSTATALPQHRYDQAALARLAADLLPEAQRKKGLVERFFSRVGVQSRALALPAERYRGLSGWESRNRAWFEVASELGERVLRDAMQQAAVDPGDVGELMTTTVTGVAVPSLDAHLMNRIRFAKGLRRVPVFGWGCLGGAAGTARLNDYLRAYPKEVAILLSVELCSLTFQADDASMANLVCAGLFGDGAAAVLLVGAEHPLADQASPVILGSRSVFFADTERMMGWDIVDTGFKPVLSPLVPELARNELPAAADAFLAEYGLGRGDISAWIAHPGGPKVLDAMREGLGLPPDALERSKRGLAEVGNLSSASVLFLLDDFRRRQRPPAGALGLMIAMGPAFCAELVLLRW